MAMVERMMVMDLQRTIAQLKPEIKGTLKEALYRISRATTARSAGKAAAAAAPAPPMAWHNAVDSLVARLLYNS